MNEDISTASGARASAYRVGLLVSVRSHAEALAAQAGGADLIDVKEPCRGALGRADNAVIASVVSAVGQACPVSAALGEWADGHRDPPPPGLTFVKWGLAGCQKRDDWRMNLAEQLAKRAAPQLVLAAYADWECALAPPLEEVFTLAQQHPGSVLLIDTCCKVAGKGQARRPTLLDWLPIPWLEDLCGRARAAQVRIALAGSLGMSEIAALRHTRPDWFAVRGAVCGDNDRQSAIVTARVRQLAALLHQPSPQN